MSMTPHEHESRPSLLNESKLLWITGTLNGQSISMMLDSGATICCLARRCFTGSRCLQNLTLTPYFGPGILDANGKVMKPSGTIKVPLVIGQPAVSHTVEFVIIDELPYSCIIGLSFLNKFSHWGVDNSRNILHLEQSIVSISSQPSVQDNIAFMTTAKYTIPPGQALRIPTIAKGSSLDALRPVSAPAVLIDGNLPFEERLHLKVVPSLNQLIHQNSCVHTTIVNCSNVSKVIGKGTKVALGTYDFDEFSALSKESINALTSLTTQPLSLSPDSDPMTHLTSQMTHLLPSQFHAAKTLLAEFSDIFSLSNTKIGKAKVTEFDFDLTHSTPISMPLRRVPLHQQSIVKELLQHYKDHGLIEHIDSPYRAATVLVAKKNVSNSSNVTDRYRLVVDYRFLNLAIKDSGWPSPSLQQCLDSVSGSQFVSSIDFNSGYHQIPCAARVKPIIAFSPGYGFGQWTWNVMPQGIKPASSLFQRTMEQTFSDLSDCILPPFYDDVVIKGSDFQQHLSNVRRVLHRIRQSGLTLNALKCKFFQTTLPYLGHIIDKGQICVDPARIQCIRAFPVPTTAKALKEFLGMSQFCDRFIPNFSVIAAPLHELAKPHSSFSWSSDARTAFETIKQLLTSAPVLRAPTSDDSFILEVDASDKGEGACLKACNSSDGHTYIVAFASRKFNDTESKWNIVEKEAHAIVFATEKFRHYLLGKPFLLRTDNRVTSFLQCKRSPKSRKLLNWALQLSEFSYHIEHIPSKNNAISDCLSRLHSVNLLEELHPDVSIASLRALQSQDPHIQAAITYVSSNNRTFDVSHLGSLRRYRHHLLLSPDGLLKWHNCIVVPIALRGRVLQLCHDHPSSGHFAIDRTWARLRAHYFWPNAKEDVSNWVKSCTTCASFNPPPHGYHKDQLQPIQSSDRFELVCYDLAGPFMPISRDGFRYALILVDHFTKWPEVVPLKEISAHTIARAIHDQWICRYGIMTRLHSDGASNVHGSVMQEVAKILGIGKSKSSRLHPQGDGLSEAMVKQVKSCVQKQVDQYGCNWDLYLQSAVYAIRSSVNNSTKVTPAELLLGAKLSLPTELLCSASPRLLVQQSAAHHVRQAQAFAIDLGLRLKRSFADVRCTLDMSRDRMKQQYDKTASKHHYKVNDTVMLWHPPQKTGISRCFQAQWSGPWTITQLIGDLNCKLVNHRGQVSPTVHVNQLKYMPPRSDYLVSPSYTPTPGPATTHASTCDIFADLPDVTERQCFHSPTRIENSQGGGNGTDTADTTEQHNTDGAPARSTADIEGDLLADNWCKVDISNILANRTRSASQRGRTREGDSVVPSKQ